MPSAVVIGTGKMGKLIEQTLIAHGFEVLGAFGHENINQLITVVQTPNVVVDFSGIAAFDAVVGFVRERGCALVLLLNKWDLIYSEAKRDEVAASVAKRLAFAPWIASINVSALTGRAIDKVLAAALSAAESRALQLKTSELNELLAQIREGGHTVSDRGRRLKIQYATQTGSKPPVISFWCNAPDLVDDNYERFIENRLREKFSLVGTPIRLKFRKKVESN